MDGATRPSRSAISTVVVGAGVTGLVCARALLEAGISVVVVEAAPDLFPGSARARFKVDLLDKYPDLGALFSFPEYKPPSGCLPEELHQYLLSYVDHFKLRQHIIFSCKLEHAQVGEDGRWCLVCSDLLDPQRLHRLTSDFLVISAGACLAPSIPQLPGSADFAGLRCHARDLRDVRDAGSLVSGQHVVVAGDDRTAVACARQAAEAGAASVTVLYRQPHWPLPHKLLGRSLPHIAYSRCLPALLFPPYYTAGGAARAMSSALAPLRRLFWWRLERRLVRRYGVDKMTRPPVNMLRDMFYNVQACPEEDNWVGVLQGSPVRLVRGDISRLGTDCVVLKDHSTLHATMIVHCTPYIRNYTVFDPEVQAALGVRKDGLHLYRSMVPPVVPSLAFLGCESAQPYGWLTASLQAHWVAQVASGRMRLPGLRDMKADVVRQRRWRRRAFPPQHNRGSLVQWYAQAYHDQLLGDMGLPAEAKRVRGCVSLFRSCASYTPDDYRPLFQPCADGSSSPYGAAAVARRRRRHTHGSADDEESEGVELALRGGGFSVTTTPSSAAAAAAAAATSGPSMTTPAAAVTMHNSRRSLLERRASMERRRSVEMPRRSSYDAASRAALAQVSVTSNASRLQLLLTSRASNLPGIEASETEAEPQIDFFGSVHSLSIPMGSAANGAFAAAPAAGGAGCGSAATSFLCGGAASNTPGPQTGMTSRRGSSIGCSRLGSQRGSALTAAVVAAAADAALPYGDLNSARETRRTSHPEIKAEGAPPQCGDKAIEAAIAAVGSSPCSGTVVPRAAALPPGARAASAGVGIVALPPAAAAAPAAPAAADIELAAKWRAVAEAAAQIPHRRAATGPSHDRAMEPAAAPVAAASANSSPISAVEDAADPSYVAIPGPLPAMFSPRPPDPWVAPTNASGVVAAPSAAMYGDLALSPGSLLPYSTPHAGFSAAAANAQQSTHGSADQRSASAGQWSSNPSATCAASGGCGGGSSAQQPLLQDLSAAAHGSSGGGGAVRVAAAAASPRHRDIGALLPPSMLSGYEVLPVSDLYPVRQQPSACLSPPAKHLAATSVEPGSGSGCIAAASAGTVGDAAAAAARPLGDALDGGISAARPRRSFEERASGSVKAAIAAAAAGAVANSSTVPVVSGVGGVGGGLLATAHSRCNANALLATSRSGLLARSSVSGARSVAAAAAVAAAHQQPRPPAALRAGTAGGGALGSSHEADLLDTPPPPRSRITQSNLPNPAGGSSSMLLFLQDHGSPSGGGFAAAPPRPSAIAAAVAAGSGSIQLAGPPSHGLASGSMGAGGKRTRRRGSAVVYSSVLGNEEFVQLLLVAGNNDGRPEGVIDVRHGAGGSADASGQHRPGDILTAAATAGTETEASGGGGRAVAALALAQPHPSGAVQCLLADRPGSPSCTASGGLMGVMQSASVVLPLSSARASRAGGASRVAQASASALTSSAARYLPPALATSASATAVAAAGGSGGNGGRVSRMGSQGPCGFATSNGFNCSTPTRDSDPAAARGSPGGGGGGVRGRGGGSGSWRRADLGRPISAYHTSTSGMHPEAARQPLPQSRSAVLDSLIHQLYQQHRQQRWTGEASSKPSARPETSSGGAGGGGVGGAGSAGRGSGFAGVSGSIGSGGVGGSGGGGSGGGAAGGWFWAVPERDDKGPGASQRGGGGSGAEAVAGGGAAADDEDDGTGSRASKPAKGVSPPRPHEESRRFIAAAFEGDDDGDMLATSMLLLGGSTSLAASLGAAVATLNASRRHPGAEGGVDSIDLADSIYRAAPPPAPASGAAGSSLGGGSPRPPPAASQSLAARGDSGDRPKDGAAAAAAAPPPPPPVQPPHSPFVSEVSAALAPGAPGAATSSYGVHLSAAAAAAATASRPSSSSAMSVAAGAAAPRRQVSEPSRGSRRLLSKHTFLRGWNNLKAALGFKSSRSSGGGTHRPSGGGSRADGGGVGDDGATGAAAAATVNDGREAKARDKVPDRPPSPFRRASSSRLSRQSSRLARRSPASTLPPAVAAAVEFQSYDMPVLGRSRSYCMPHDPQHGGGGGGAAADATAATSGHGGGGGGALYGGGQASVDVVRRAGSGGSFTAGFRSTAGLTQLPVGSALASRIPSRDSRGSPGSPFGGAAASPSMRRKSTLGLGALTRLNSTGAATGGGGGVLSSIVGTGSVSRGGGGDGGDAATLSEFDDLRTVPGSPGEAQEGGALFSHAAAANATAAAPSSVGDGATGGGAAGCDGVAPGGGGGSGASRGALGSWEVGARAASRRLPFRQASSVALAVDAAAAVLAAGAAAVSMLPTRGGSVGASSCSPASQASAGGGGGSSAAAPLQSLPWRNADAAAAAAPGLYRPPSQQGPHPFLAAQMPPRLRADARPGINDDPSSYTGGSTSTWAALVASPGPLPSPPTAGVSSAPAGPVPALGRQVGGAGGALSSQAHRFMFGIAALPHSAPPQSQQSQQHSRTLSQQQQHADEPRGTHQRTYSSQGFLLPGGRGSTGGGVVVEGGDGLPSQADSVQMGSDGVEGSGPMAAAAAAAAAAPPPPPLPRVRALPRRQPSLLRTLLSPTNGFGGGGGGGGGGVSVSGTGMLTPPAAASPVPNNRPSRRPLKRVVSELPASLRNGRAGVAAEGAGGAGSVVRRLGADGSSMGMRAPATDTTAAPLAAASATGYTALHDPYGGGGASGASPPHSPAGRRAAHRALSRRDSIIGNLLAEMAGVGVGVGVGVGGAGPGKGQAGDGGVADPHAPEGVIAWERPRAWDEAAPGGVDGGGGGGGGGGCEGEEPRALRGTGTGMRDSSTRAPTQLAAAAAAVLPSVMLGHGMVPVAAPPPPPLPSAPPPPPPPQWRGGMPPDGPCSGAGPTCRG